MTTWNYCRFCRKRRVSEDFVEKFRCIECASEGRGARSVAVNLEGWHMPVKMLPEMYAPSQGAQKGPLGWSATKGPWLLEVRWVPESAHFACRNTRADVAPDTVSETVDYHVMDQREFRYPHEVIQWIGIWSLRISGDENLRS